MERPYNGDMCDQSYCSFQQLRSNARNTGGAKGRGQGKLGCGFKNK